MNMKNNQSAQTPDTKRSPWGRQAWGRQLLTMGCIFGSTAITMLSGCHALNESVRMRGADPIPAIESQPAVQFKGEPTLTGIDRSNWPATQVSVSVNDSESHATYGTWWLLNDQPNRRDAGLYPTVNSALDVPNSPHDTKMLYAELFFEPFHQLVNIGLIPYFLVTNKPFGTTEYGSSYSYQRELSTDAYKVELAPRDDTP